jgi:vancomycin resistance protein VanJ
MRRKRNSRWPGLLAVANLLLLAAVYFAGRFVAERTLVTTFIAYVPQPFFLFPTVLLFVGFVLTRQFRTALLFAGPTAVLASLLLGFRIPVNPAEGVHPTLSVMTYNIAHCEGGWKQIADVIRKADADVVCLQEADQEGASTALGAEPIPGYRMVSRGEHVVYSKRPIEHADSWELAPGTRPALVARIGDLLVVNVHLMSFPESSRDIRNLKKIPRKFSNVGKVHLAQAESLLARLDGQGTVIVCGDFNNPPRGEVYDRLRQELDDSFASVGIGTGFTYPSVMPIQRIDYVLSRGLTPVATERIKTRLSDHLPVLARFLQ